MLSNDLHIQLDNKVEDIVGLVIALVIALSEFIEPPRLNVPTAHL